MAVPDPCTAANRRAAWIARPAWTTRPIGVAVLAAVGIAGVQVLDPAHTHVPLCPFHTVTGLWCPLCGGLRSVYALTRLDLAGAIRDNALFVVAVPCLVYYWIDWLRRERAGLPERRFSRASIATLWLIAIVFCVLRNLPISAAWLAPT
jgi:hypothetical protein